MNEGRPGGRSRAMRSKTVVCGREGATSYVLARYRPLTVQEPARLGRGFVTLWLRYGLRQAEEPPACRFALLPHPLIYDKVRLERQIVPECQVIFTVLVV